jgi:hypothetical protein
MKPIDGTGQFINVEPTWETCARIFIELVAHPKDAEAREVGIRGLMDMAEKLDAVRQQQIRNDE